MSAPTSPTWSCEIDHLESVSSPAAGRRNWAASAALSSRAISDGSAFDWRYASWYPFNLQEAAMRRRPTLGNQLVTLTVLSLLAACGSDKTTSPKTTASVRIVNASSSTSSLNASTTSSQSLSSGLNFQNGNAPTTCSTVNSG